MTWRQSAKKKAKYERKDEKNVINAKRKRDEDENAKRKQDEDDEYNQKKRLRKNVTLFKNNELVAIGDLVSSGQNFTLHCEDYSDKYAIVHVQYVVKDIEINQGCIANLKEAEQANIAWPLEDIR